MQIYTIINDICRGFDTILRWISARSAADISAIANVVVAAIAVLGLPIALSQLKNLLKSRDDALKQRKRDSAKTLLNVYLKEYRSVEMGRAIAALWKLYYVSKKKKESLVDNYVKLYFYNRNRNFHFNIRRRVSAFYQELSLFVEKDDFAKEEIYSMWAKANLNLIPKVLIPIETMAIPRILAKESNEALSPLAGSSLHSIAAMERLYENAPER
jgi:hypothetical protein